MPVFPTSRRIVFLGLAAFFICFVPLFAEQTQSITANKERMIQSVRFLSEANFPRTADQGHKEKTINYILQSLCAAGLEAKLNELVVKAVLRESGFSDTSVNSYPSPVIELADSLHSDTLGNIHALKKGKTNKRIIIGAHYDVVHDSPGADDNASAVAVLIELAYLLKEAPELNCDVELVSYDLEENGLYGSRFHVAQLKKQNVDVVCMFCLDMVGYFSDAEHSQDYPVSTLSLLYGSKGNFLAMIGKPKDGELLKKSHAAFQAAASIKIVPFPVPLGLDILLSRSDHGYFWKEGYPALFLTDTAEYRNKNYHKPTDTWKTLDYNRLIQIPVGLYHTLLALDAAHAPVESPISL